MDSRKSISDAAHICQVNAASKADQSFRVSMLALYVPIDPVDRRASVVPKSPGGVEGRGETTSSSVRRASTTTLGSLVNYPRNDSHNMASESVPKNLIDARIHKSSYARSSIGAEYDPPNPNQMQPANCPCHATLSNQSLLRDNWITVETFRQGLQPDLAPLTNLISDPQTASKEAIKRTSYTLGLRASTNDL